jgi:hypothetical protein
MYAMMKTKSVVIFLLLLFSAPGWSFSKGGPGPEGNYTVYAVFLYNFIKYTEWPNDNSKLVITILDNSKAAAEISKMAQAKSIPTREIIVINTSDEKELLASHMIFVPANSSAAFLKMADKLKTKPIMVVTEEADMVSQGASVSFKIVSDKLRFQINSESSKSRGLKISSTIDALAVK